MKIACIGEAMIELSLDPDKPQTAALGVAGDTLNTAIYLARRSPFEISYVTCLGRDAMSDRMMAFMAAEGLDTAQIFRDESRVPGLYAITTDDRGERSFTYWRDRSAARLMFQDGDFTALQDFDVVYLSAISLAIMVPEAREKLLEWLSTYRASGGQVGFDSNYRPALWPDQATARDVIGRMWGLTDIALPSVDDEMAIFGDTGPEAVVARLRKMGVTHGALKCGAGGPRSLGAEVNQDYPPAERVVDTTAAGDSFNGGYLAAFLAGEDHAAALLAGHNCARYVVGFKGAIVPRDDASRV